MLGVRDALQWVCLHSRIHCTTLQHQPTYQAHAFRTISEGSTHSRQRDLRGALLRGFANHSKDNFTESGSLVLFYIVSQHCLVLFSCCLLRTFFESSSSTECEIRVIISLRTVSMLRDRYKVLVMTLTKPLDQNSILSSK